MMKKKKKTSKKSPHEAEGVLSEQGLPTEPDLLPETDSFEKERLREKDSVADEELDRMDPERNLGRR
jgi:hypothetical protein